MKDIVCPKSVHPTFSPTQGHDQSNGATDRGIEAAWARRAAELAKWFDRHLVNRRDAFGHYIAVEQRRDPDLTAFTDKTGLSPEILARHARGASTGDRIGLHSTSRDEPAGGGQVAACWSRWLAIDIDRHADSVDPEATWKAALAWYERARALGFHGLLIDSNGRGGYHLWLIFDGPVPTEKVHAFGKWMIRDWKDLGLAEPPETFPKQPAIKAGGFGNWLRLPGPHHTRDHWSRVWDVEGERWLEGADAVEAILATTGTPASAIPAEALELPKPARPPKRTKARDDLDRDARLAREALGHLGHLADGYDDWIRIGQSLTPLGAIGLELWDEWSSQSSKYQEGVCERKWRTFTRDGGRTLGTLFQEADGSGWEGQKRRRSAPSPRAERNGPPKPSNNGTGEHPGGGHPPGGSEEPEKPEPRAEIVITTKRHEVVEQAVACLPRDLTLYRRCERLVTVIEDLRTRVKITRRTVVRQQERTPRIIVLSTSVIGLVLTRNGDWFQWKKDPEGEFVAIPAHPPDWAIKAVETIGHWPGVRFLRAVAEAPFIRPDGSVVDVPGYDADTETLYVPSGVFQAVAARPTQKDARAAAKKLFKLVEQFPFVDDNHRLVWLAALLSVIGRPAITGPCPGFCFDANVAGTGKTLLATIIGMIATGRDVATIGYAQDSVEMGKIITSVALAGYAVVLLDNVPNGSKFGNDQLDRALTSTVVDGRELGKSRMVGMLDLSSVWIITGNNISPTGDSFRRWFISRIESLLERPDRRNDLEIPDLPQYIREHRGDLVAAALTILRAHAEAGWPVGEWAPIGSYTDWERVVRGAVWFATGGDCCATQDQFAEEDPERLERTALAEGWLELPGGNNTGLTSGQALELVQAEGKKERDRKYETLRNIFLEWGSKGELASPRTIGNRLKAIKGQVIGNKKFVPAGEVKRALRWKVVRVGGESGESGESGSQAPARDLRTNSHMRECRANGKSPEGSPGLTHQTHQTHLALDDPEALAERAAIQAADAEP